VLPPPGRGAFPETIALAETLGHSTAWVYDTSALQLDCWMTLALAATRTRRIRLGPGVMIPSLRHPMVTASAIATLVSLVGKNRVVVGIGAGFTDRRAMGQKPLRWQDMPRRLARSLRDLQNIVHELREKGVHLKATEQPIDTSSAAAKAFLSMLGVFGRCG